MENFNTCPKCGNAEPAENKFCSKCGSPIQPVQPVQPEHPVQTAQPVQPAQPSQPVQPVQPAQPMQPAQQQYVPQPGYNVYKKPMEKKALFFYICLGGLALQLLCSLVGNLGVFLGAAGLTSFFGFVGDVGFCGAIGGLLFYIKEKFDEKK